MNLIRTYASWTRRQGSTMNCGAPVGAGLLALAVVALITIIYWPVIWPVLVIIFWSVVASSGAVALGYIALAVFAAHRRAVARAAAGPRQLPARPPEPDRPSFDQLLAARAALPDAGAEVPVSPDNRAAADPGTAADLAAVLARTGQWRRSHP